MCRPQPHRVGVFGRGQVADPAEIGAAQRPGRLGAARGWLGCEGVGKVVQQGPQGGFPAQGRGFLDPEDAGPARATGEKRIVALTKRSTGHAIGRVPRLALEGGSAGMRSPRKARHPGWLASGVSS